MLRRLWLSAVRRRQRRPAPTTLYSPSNLTGWINTARGQLSGEGECIPNIGTLAVTAGQNVYPFTSIVLSGAQASAIQGVIKINTAWVQTPSGLIWLRPRPFPWFSLYELNNPVYNQPSNYARPKVWSQYGQGVNGTIYLSPVPDINYTLSMDCICYPIPLVDDSTVEAIPYFWTDAVPYFGAYLALLSAQTGGREAYADRMFERYTEFVNRARRFATPNLLPGIYPQTPNITRQNQLGLNQGGGGGNG